MNATDSGIPIVVSDSNQKTGEVYFSLADKVSKFSSLFTSVSIFNALAPSTMLLSAAELLKLKAFGVLELSLIHI